MPEPSGFARLTPARLLGQMIAVGTVLALFQVVGLEILVYYITNPSWPEIWQMLTLPGPVVFVLLALFFFCAYLYLRPLLAFLSSAGTKSAAPIPALLALQDRSVNFPYFMALLAFPFYMFGGPLATWLVGRRLGWPGFIAGYGFLGGLVSAALTAPLSVYAYHWMVEPITRLIAAAGTEIPPGRRAGVRLPVQAKLIATVIILVAAWTAYAVLVGYRQNQLLLENLEQMERLVPAELRSELKNEATNVKEPGARSSAYFHSRFGSLKWLYFSLLVVAVAMALVVAWAAAQEITRPLSRLAAAAERVRRGIYQEPVELVNNDELAELGGTFNRMMRTILEQMQALTAVMERIHGGLRRMDESLGTVQSVSTEQAGGASQQAAAVQEASSIAEEIAAAARQISERARQVDEIAQSTLGACRLGEQKLGRAGQGFNEIAGQVEAIVSAMRELEDRFQAIYRMVAMTGEIAEQTELLAFNAALEAAGAGAAGRRFRVVAEATKRLATRAAEAGREIRELVRAIQGAAQETIRLAEVGKEKVATGAGLMNEAVEAIQSLSETAAAASRAAGEIRLATRQQTSGSEHLAGTVAEVQEVARRVESGAKRIQAAISELQSFAEALREMLESRPVPKGSAD